MGTRRRTKKGGIMDEFLGKCWENDGKMMGKVWEVVVEASKKWYSKVQPTDIINGIVMYGLVIGFSGNLMGFHRNQWENCGTSWEDLTI